MNEYIHPSIHTHVSLLPFLPDCVVFLSECSYDLTWLQIKKERKGFSAALTEQQCDNGTVAVMTGPPPANKTVAAAWRDVFAKHPVQAAFALSLQAAMDPHPACMDPNTGRIESRDGRKVPPSKVKINKGGRAVAINNGGYKIRPSDFRHVPRAMAMLTTLIDGAADE